MRNEVRRHGAAALIGRSLSLGTNVAMTVLLARALEPSSFSNFAIFRTVITFIGLVVSGGLGTVALRLLSERKVDALCLSEAIRRILLLIVRATIVVSILLCFLIAAIIPPISPWLFGAPGGFLLVAAVIIASLGIGWLQIITDAARGLDQPSPAAYHGGVRGTPFASIVLFVVLYAAPSYVHGDWLKAGLIYGFGLIASVAITSRDLVSIIARSPAHEAPAAEHGIAFTDFSLVTLAAMAWPLTVSGSLMFLTTGGDLFLAAWFPSEVDRDGYVAARRWTLLVATPLSALSLTAGSLIAGATSTERKHALQSFLRAGTTLIGIPALLFSFAAMIAPERMITILFGSGYEAAASVLPVLVIGQLFVVITGPCGLVLSLTGNERISLQLAMLGFLALVFLGPWIAKEYGAIGLSWFVTISVAVINIVTWLQCWRLTGMNTMLEPTLVLKPRQLLVRLHLSRKPSGEPSDNKPEVSANSSSSG